MANLFLLWRSSWNSLDLHPHANYCLLFPSFCLSLLSYFCNSLPYVQIPHSYSNFCCFYPHLLHLGLFLADPFPVLVPGFLLLHLSSQFLPLVQVLLLLVLIVFLARFEALTLDSLVLIYPALFFLLTFLLLFCSPFSFCLGQLLSCTIAQLSLVDFLPPSTSF